MKSNCWVVVKPNGEALADTTDKDRMLCVENFLWSYEIHRAWSDLVVDGYRCVRGIVTTAVPMPATRGKVAKRAAHRDPMLNEPSATSGIGRKEDGRG